MVRVIIIVFSYFLGRQLINLKYIIFNWKEIINSSNPNNNIEKAPLQNEKENTPVANVLSDMCLEESEVVEKSALSEIFTDSGIPYGHGVMVINLSAYLALLSYVIFTFFHGYIGLRYCGVYMLPVLVLLIFFVTLEYIPILPVFWRYSFPEFTRSRIFCLLETIVKITYYLLGNYILICMPV